MERNTEIANKECLRSIRRPFPIGNVVVAVDIETKLLCALHTISLGNVLIVDCTNSAEFF